MNYEDGWLMRAGDIWRHNTAGDDSTDFRLPLV